SLVRGVRLLLLTCVGLGGCLAPGTHSCGDNSCPATRTCSPAGQCVLPEQLSACAGKEEGKDCSFDGSDGVCVSGACDPRRATIAPAPTVTLYAVSGSGRDDVLAVGTGGSMLHFDGTSWTQLEPITTQNLRGLSRDPTGPLYAVGDTAVLRYDGQLWTRG